MRLALLALLLGCAGGRAAGGGSEVRRDVIGSAELEQFEVRTTILQAIQRLHPSWLEVRGKPTLRPTAAIAVYINRQPRTTTGELARLTVGEAREIRYLNGIEATAQFGTDHGSGAILVTLR